MGKLKNSLTSIGHEVLIEWSFFLIFVVFLLKININSNLFFHTAIELFINIVFLLVFVFAFNTYGINKNNSILILGTGYFFVSAVGILHLLAYPGMPFIIGRDNIDVSAQLWIAARYIGVCTCLVSVLFILKPNKKFNPYFLFIAYLCITIFVLFSILTLKIFPTCYIRGVGLTTFKVVSEYIIFFLFIGAAVIYLKIRKKVDKYLFICLECFFVLSAISEMFFVNFMLVSEWTNVIGHIVKLIAAYFLYKGVVETGIKRPYNLVNNDLDVADAKVKLFEEIIIKNEQCASMLINNSNDAVFLLRDYKFIFANKKTAELFGLESTDEIINSSVERFIVSEVRNEAYNRFNSAMKNKSGIPFTESKLLRSDGQIVYVEVANCFCMYKGRPSVMVMIRDITLRKQIEILENKILENNRLISKTSELNKMMTEFFSNISHELKTPLNVILGAVQILSLPTKEIVNTEDNFRTNKYLKTMKQNCYRLVRLVNNLIDISKFDSGYFKLDLHNHNVVNVIEDITLSVSDYAENKGIELIFDTDVEEKVMAIDLDKIERIILNLLSNAIKFTDEGGQILVSLWDRNDSIVISVKDSGVGMPKDKIDMIFERFGQVDKTLARNREGSGIGLSLVKSIVDMHGGNIKVQSEYGKGSEFLIELPVKVIEDEKNTVSILYESRVEKISVEFSDIYSY